MPRTTLHPMLLWTPRKRIRATRSQIKGYSGHFGDEPRPRKASEEQNWATVCRSQVAEVGQRQAEGQQDIAKSWERTRHRMQEGREVDDRWAMWEEW